MIDKKAFRTLSYGLFVIASKTEDGRKAACIANTFQQVGSDPVRVSVSLHKDNATTTAVQQTGRFTASVLTEEATMELIGTFGFRSSLDTDKFAEVDYELDSANIPCLQQACVARFSVVVEQTVDVGSHLLFIGSVDEAQVLGQQRPITYAYYHEVLRGKTPPKAASYQTDSAQAKEVPAKEPASDIAAAPETDKKPTYAWRCTLCGYIEYVDELPDDFVCPICGVGKEMFERIEV